MRNKQPLLFIIIFVLCFTWFHPVGITNADNSNTITINEDHTNIRSGPGLSYSKIAQVHKGESFSLIKVEGDWLQIQLSNNKKGWVANWLVSHNSSKSASSDTIQTGDKVLVDADGLRVRSRPSTENKVLTSVNKGMTLTVLETNGHWIKIEANWTVGWVSTDYVYPIKQSQQTSTAQKNGTVTASVLRVRSEPSTNGEILAKVKKGTTFSILEEKNNWVKIEYASGKYGWVSTWYLNISSAPPAVASNSQVKDGSIEILHNGTNIRKQPTVQSEVVQRANHGDRFEVVSLEKEWYQIRLKNGETAYVAGWIVLAKGATPQIVRKETGGSLKNKTIVIDPGHGGKDVGTTGYNGTLEKDVTLSTAQLLRNKLKAAGANVVLTRSNDQFYSLNSRVRTSHYHGADAFISIHYDSIRDKSVSGMTSYYYHNFQKPLASVINSAVSKAVGLKNRGTRFGEYYVIRENKQYAVLLELGYLSNPTEEKLIKSRQFQEKAAEGIFQGLNQFFNR